MSAKIADHKHSEVNRYRYQRNHRIGQEIKPLKRRVDQEHRIDVIGRRLRNESTENQIAITANGCHYENGNDDIDYVSFHVNLDMPEDR